ncbi:hypothetical protein [Arthrobacter sp. NamB2]|nr:hypothetical protein [Arthrobacter sp. NamB2]
MAAPGAGAGRRRLQPQSPGDLVSRAYLPSGVLHGTLGERAVEE